MTWEYKVVRLTRTEPSVSWDEEGDLHSAQLTAIAQDGWEIISVEPWPWVVFRRKADTNGKAGADDGSSGPRQE